MGRNGDVRITTLKSATGIASNDLSAHHPNGPGVNTRFSEFLISGLGRKPSGWSQGDTLEDHYEGYKVNGSLESGSLDTNDQWTFDNVDLVLGDEISFLVDIDQGTNIDGQEWIEAIGVGNGDVDYSLGGNFSLVTVNKISDDQMEVVVKIDDYANGLNAGVVFNDKVNTDAEHYGNSGPYSGGAETVFSMPAGEEGGIPSPQPIIVSVTNDVVDTGGGEYSITFTISVQNAAELTNSPYFEVKRSVGGLTVASGSSPLTATNQEAESGPEFTIVIEMYDGSSGPLEDAVTYTIGDGAEPVPGESTEDGPTSRSPGTASDPYNIN